MIDNTEGDYVAERIRASSLAVGESSPVEAMLANALREGKPLSDDGALHDTVQGAQDAASSFVFVPPGTFHESVTVDTPGLTLLGSGRATLIDGGSGIPITSSSNYVDIKNIECISDGDDGILLAGDNCIANNVSISGNFNRGIGIEGADGIAINSYLDGGNYGVRIMGSGTRGKIIGCRAVNCYKGLTFRVGPHDCIMSSNTVIDSADHGIEMDGASDSIVIGNRVHNSGNNGIQCSSTDSIVANNRVSDSTNADISTTVTTNLLLDANLTGSAN